MTRFIGQITVILEARDTKAAQQRIKRLASHLDDSSRDIEVADHHGRVENYAEVQAQCEALLKSSPCPLIPFDAYEVQGVRRYGSGKSSYCETVDEDNAQFWSLYGHIPGQGVICIGDYRTREFAEEMYTRITGIPFAIDKFVQVTNSMRCHSNDDLRDGVIQFELRSALTECVRLLADYDESEGEEGDAYRRGLAALGLTDQPIKPTGE